MAETPSIERLSEIKVSASIYVYSENATLANFQNVYKLVVRKTIIGFFSLLEIDSDTIKVDYFFMYPEYIGNGNGRWLIRSAIELF